MSFFSNLYRKIVARIDRYVAGVVLDRIDYHQLAEWIDDAKLRACVDHESVGVQLVSTLTQSDDTITKLSKALCRGGIGHQLDIDYIADVINRDLDYDDIADRVSHQVEVDYIEVAEKVAENMDEDLIMREITDKLNNSTTYEQIAMALARAAVKAG